MTKLSLLEHTSPPSVIPEFSENSKQNFMKVCKSSRFWSRIRADDPYLSNEGKVFICMENIGQNLLLTIASNWGFISHYWSLKIFKAKLDSLNSNVFIF